MRSILLITTMMICGSTIAQPILTAANTNPSPGDTYTQNFLDTTGLAAASTGPGAAKTWDYSHLAVISDGYDSLITARFVACSATPYCDSFPGTTIADISYDYYIGGGEDSNFDYYLTNASEYAVVGSTDGFTFSHYASPLKLVAYPFTYFDKTIDTFYAYAAPDSVATMLTDTFTADAYGTLKLPYGTYSNALRVHLTSYESDSTFFVGDTSVTTYSSDSYIWFVPGFHYPVLQIDNDTTGGTPVDVIYYTGTFADGVKNIAPVVLKDVAVYPNPAYDELNVFYTSLTGQPATLRLSDVTGRCVSTTIDHPAIGANTTTLSVSTFPAGIYFLQVQSGDNVVSKKVNVMR